MNVEVEKFRTTMTTRTMDGPRERADRLLIVAALFRSRMVPTRDGGHVLTKKGVVWATVSKQGVVTVTIPKGASSPETMALLARAFSATSPFQEVSS